MNRWDSERLAGWAAVLAVLAFAVVGTSAVAPWILPRAPATLLGHALGFACCGLCFAAVLVEPERRR